jgi:hypothetical protein
MHYGQQKAALIDNYLFGEVLPKRGLINPSMPFQRSVIH